jgi:hypothetical protein
MWDDLFSGRATRQPDLNTCHQPLKAYLLGKGALNDTFETHKQLICYLLFVIALKARYRTRALILRPLFMMLTWPEARRSATVATVSS